MSARPPLDVACLGQVFTPDEIVARMLALRRNRGRVLEPSAGDGAFSLQLPGCVAIELDARHAPPGALVMDFFAYPAAERFDTIIGNPPYVRFQDVAPETRKRLDLRLFDGRSNLYLFFIEKCVRHLNPGGELIFITPRDFLKATAARKLNTWLHEQGSFTDLIELGDARVFDDAVPNCVIWRFEKGNLRHRTFDGRRQVLAGGQLLFTRGIYSVPLSAVFSVKVGAVSGADEVFAHAELGNMDFVCSRTAQTGELRRMIFDTPLPWLEQHRERLLARRVRPFDASNWWQWGRRHHLSEAPRVYVNGRTRKPRPFFTHDCIHYDGAVLALFPHRREVDVDAVAGMLNEVDWAELGFVCDGRYLFAQRSLEQALLPEPFATLALAG
jgi:adenine-specific DNA-methyltransferase